jgi:hypothetical protein
MRPDVYDLDVPAALGAGLPLPVIEYRDKTIQVTGTFVGSLQIEGTIDGTNYDAVTPSISSDDLLTIPHTLQAIRVRLTELTSGTPVVKFAGVLVR